jgi:hypothetical protein
MNENEKEIVKVEGPIEFEENIDCIFEEIEKKSFKKKTNEFNKYIERKCE